jgi:hypothetical protein
MTAITLNLPEDIYQYLINRPDRDALTAAALHEVMVKEVEGAIPDEHIEGILRGITSIENGEEGMGLEDYMALRHKEKEEAKKHAQ